MAISALRATVTADNPGTTAGVPAIVLIDGSDTAVTANGLSGYVPISGDRVLCARVGGQVEIVQFLARDNITGQTFRTAVTGERVEIELNNDLNPAGLVSFYDANPHLDPTRPTHIYANDQELGFEFVSNIQFVGAGALNNDDSQDFTLSNPSLYMGSHHYDGTQTSTVKGYAPGVEGGFSDIVLQADYLDLNMPDIDIGGNGGTLNMYGDVEQFNGHFIIQGGTSGKYLQIGYGTGTAIHELTYGLTTVNVTSDTNGSQTVPHGLATTPTLLLATCYGTSTWFATTTSRNSSNFQAVVRQFQNTAGTVSIPVFWLAAW